MVTRAPGMPDILILDEETTPKYQRVRETYWVGDLRDAEKTPIFFFDGEVMLERAGTLCGLYCQRREDQYSMLIRCLTGSAVIAAVDLRNTSKTYKRYKLVALSETMGRQMYIPEGFAYGYISKDDNTRLQVKAEKRIGSVRELVINPLDMTLNIPWHVLVNSELILSEKERCAPNLADAERLIYYLPDAEKRLSAMEGSEDMGVDGSANSH